ncbi:hypothetical protein FRB90_012284 [Tulasnella sp. 427]|nr:hypothetical protein FRB90_012284 [Tulasnella sp. 427]
MRLTSLLALLVASLIASAKYVINDTSYSAGMIHLGVSTFSDAPPNANVYLASERSKQLMGAVNPAGSGVLDLALPANTSPGTYYMQMTDPTNQAILSSSKKFVVRQGDLAAASSLGLSTPSLSFSVTGPIIPLLSTSLVTDASGSTSLATLTVGPSIQATSSISLTSVSPSFTPTVAASSASTDSSASMTPIITSTITGTIFGTAI